MRDAIGGPGNPMPRQVLDDKFLRQARPLVGEQRATRLLEAVWSIDSIPNVQDLAALF